MSKDNKMLMFDKWYVTACFWGHEWNLGVRWSLQGPQYIPYTDGDGIPWAKPNDTFVVLRFCGATKSVAVPLLWARKSPNGSSAASRP